MGITQREANFKFNMKLIAGLFAAVLAIDCPNDGWEANSDDNECIPATNTVSITCNADTMVVTLDARHLYVEMDASHVDEAESAAFVGSCTSSTYNSASGTYTITVPLDDCGTDVSQTGGEITFANTIYGSDGAITVDGIIITEKLELDVACSYTDSFDLTVSEIGVEEGTHVLDGSSSLGDFSTQFELKSYIDSAYSSESSSSNPVVIGSPVYNRISVTGSIPSNVAYVVTDCDAQDAATSPTVVYGIIEDGCLDTLTAAAEESSYLRGSSSSTVDFSFNGFTFESSSDTLYLQCTIEMCALNTDGTFVDSTCGFAYGDDDCADATSTMGLTKATAVDVTDG